MRLQKIHSLYIMQIFSHLQGRKAFLFNKFYARMRNVGKSSPYLLYFLNASRTQWLLSKIIQDKEMMEIMILKFVRSHNVIQDLTQ